MPEWHQLWPFYFEKFTDVATFFDVSPSDLRHFSAPARSIASPSSHTGTCQVGFTRDFCRTGSEARRYQTDISTSISIWQRLGMEYWSLMSTYIYSILFVRSRRFPCAATCGARAALVSCRGTWAPLAECILEARHLCMLHSQLPMASCPRNIQVEDFVLGMCAVMVCSCMMFIYIYRNRYANMIHVKNHWETLIWFLWQSLVAHVAQHFEDDSDLPNIHLRLALTDAALILTSCTTTQPRVHFDIQRNKEMQM